jgi:hypothetical protein
MTLRGSPAIVIVASRMAHESQKPTRLRAVAERNVTDADGQRHCRCMNELGRYGPARLSGVGIRPWKSAPW